MALSVENDVARDVGAEPIEVISTKAVLGADVARNIILDAQSHQNPSCRANPTRESHLAVGMR